MSKHFTKDERNELSILLKKGYSHRDIAKSLEKDHSSITRELNRNSVNGIYNPIKAHIKSVVKRNNAKYQNMKINQSSEFVEYLETHLKLGWTPEQITGRWNKQYPDKKHFSFKAIYKFLYSSYGQRLCKYLPSGKYHRRRRKGKKQKRLPVKNRISIEKRPKIINDRKRFGDFEADVLGSPKTDKERLPAMVERISRKLFAVKVPGLKYAVDGFNLMLKPYRDILKSVTFDNGPENARHLELNTKTYFCHPFASWEKGQVENTLGRLRRFIKKKTNISDYTDQEIGSFIEKMNDTPRKCLGFQTPNEIFNKQLIKARRRIKY
jgi:IS30 family transposase